MAVLRGVLRVGWGLRVPLLKVAKEQGVADLKPQGGVGRRANSWCQRSHVKTKADPALNAETALVSVFVLKGHRSTVTSPWADPDPGGLEALLSCPGWALRALRGKLSQDFPVQRRAAQLRTDAGQPGWGRVLLGANILGAGQPQVS